MSSGQIQLLSVILLALGVVFIPMLVLMVRIIIKWTKVESALDNVVTDLNTLVSTTDRRLRWLEENIWKRNRGQIP